MSYQEIMGVIDANAAKFEALLPEHFQGDVRFFIARAKHFITSKVNDKGDVSKCSPGTVFKSLMDAAQLGLPVDGTRGLAYLVPFKQTCQLIIGYKGMIDLAAKLSGVTIDCEVVREGDDFEFRKGTESFLRHKWGWQRGAIKGFWALAKLPNGSERFEVMSLEDVEGIRARSKAAQAGFSPWQSDFIAMGKKSVVRRLFNYVPLSPLMTSVLEHDNDTDGFIETTAQVGPAIEPRGSKADALAKQLGHTPQPNIEEDLNRARDEREAAEDFAHAESAGEGTESEHTEESSPAPSVTAGDLLAIALDEAGFNRRADAAKVLGCETGDVIMMINDELKPTADQIDRLEQANVDVRRLRGLLGFTPAAAGSKRKLD